MPYCNDVRRYSRSQYRLLTRYFNFRLSVSELGRTDRFLLFLAECEHRHGLGLVQIFKASPRRESIWGNDIDLFIQNPLGTFDWYILQAKVMSFNGAYRDLKVRPDAARQQWDRLLDHEQSFGSKAFYLLYNGRSQRPPVGRAVRADCMGVPSTSELGLGIVEANVVAAIRTNVLTPWQMFYFHHVFPDHIDSIRKLFCCSPINPRSRRQFRREEIDIDGYINAAFLPFDGRELSDDVKEPEVDIDDTVELKEGQAPLRIIVMTGEERG